MIAQEEKHQPITLEDWNALMDSSTKIDEAVQKGLTGPYKREAKNYANTRLWNR